MPFEFNCPQGHLLSAEPEQVGQLVECPMCQSQFAIPTPAAAPPAAAPPPPAAAPPPVAPPRTATQSAPPNSPPLAGADAEGFDPLGGIDLPAGDEDAGEYDDGGFGDIDIYSIPCPNGHILETPAEMIGQHAMCPHCQAQFELREKDSNEYKERRRREIERHDAVVGEKWLKRAIWIAVAVGVGLIIMVIVSIARG